MDLELPPEARALLDAVVAIGSDLDLRGVLSRIVEAACRLTDADYGILGIVDENGAFIDMVPNALAAEKFDDIGQLPDGHGLLGLVPRERRPVRVAHVVDHPESTGFFPNSHPLIDRFLGAPVLVGEEAFGHLYLGNKRGGAEFTATDEALVAALGSAAGVMIDHARTWEQTEWRRRWLDMMAEVTVRGGPTQTGQQRVQQLLGDLVEALRELCDASHVSLVLAGEGGLLEVQQSAGRTDIPLDELSEMIRHTVEDGKATQLSVSADRVRMVVPVRTRLAGAGALVVEEARVTSSLRGIMIDMVAISADRMALIMDRDAALRDRARLLVAKDRDRIARDLHDLVIQRLFATGMQLQAAQGLSEGELRQRAGDAVAELDATIKELRSTIFELTAGTNLPLLDEVRTLLGDYSRILGFQPVLRVVGPVNRALPAAAANHVLTALREALSNVARHARATAVTVELNAGSAWFLLRVTDNGVGFDPATVERGNGSTNLGDRAQELGGHLAVKSTPGGGTTLDWVIPALS